MAILNFDTLSDEALMDFIHGGNVRAFETLVKRHHRRFYNMAYRWVLHPHDAEDIVQDSFTKIWSGKAKWKANKKAKFTTWFYRIIHNQAVDMLRSKSRPHSELTETIASDDLPADERLATAAQEKRLRETLLELTEPQRMAVMLFYYEALSQKEIAKIMGIGVKALESLLSRARATLKERMSDEHASLYAAG